MGIIMKLHLKSINAKIILLYLFLAIINMSFFTIMIYENQIDLIMENSKYHMKEITEDLVISLKKISSEMKNSKIFSIRNRKEAIKEISTLFNSKILAKDKDADLIIYNEKGDTLYKSKPDISFSKSDMKHGITAITNLEYTGRQMYSAVNEKTYVISFYIPYKLAFLGDSIMLLKIEIKELKKRLDELYILIMIVVIFIALFHMVFAIIVNRQFVHPIQLLHGKSLEIRRGNLEARAEVKRNDEIGELGMAFNSMADSIQEKIISLESHNEKMNYELKMAGGVQKLIFPELISDHQFNIGLFHKPFTEVSGDYYDIIDLDDSRRGFLLVDVSGHGMPAALVTMIVKEIFDRDAKKYSDPSELLKLMNTMVINLLQKNDMFSGIYFTAFYMIIDNNNFVHFCNAGHQQVIILQPEKKQLARINSCGAPIGISEDMNDMYRTGRIKLSNGDKICMFTDGITEPKNGDGDEFGTKRIISSIKKVLKNPVESMIEEIIDDLMVYVENKKLDDDATLIMVEIK